MATKLDRTGTERNVRTPPRLDRLVAKSPRVAVPVLRDIWRCRRWHGPAAGTCWPTMAGMGSRVGRAASTVCEHVRLLEGARVVTLLVAGGQDRPNVYLLAGYDRPDDDALAAVLVEAWGIDEGEAAGVLAIALATTAHRRVRRRLHPTDRQHRTCHARIDRHAEKVERAGAPPPSRPRKSAQARPRKSACNPISSGHVSTSLSAPPTRWVPDPTPAPVWSEAQRAAWRERTAGVHVSIDRGSYRGGWPASPGGFDRTAALMALREDLGITEMDGPTGRLRNEGGP